MGGRRLACQQRGYRVVPEQQGKQTKAASHTSSHTHVLLLALLVCFLNGSIVFYSQIQRAGWGSGAARMEALANSPYFPVR